MKDNKNKSNNLNHSSSSRTFIILFLAMVASSLLHSTHYTEALSIKSTTPMREDNRVVHATTAYKRLLTRHIQKCKTVEEALSILEHERHMSGSSTSTTTISLGSDPQAYENQYAETLNLCGRHKNVDAALEIVRLLPDSELCRSKAISICGSCGRLEDALRLVFPTDHQQQQQQQQHEDNNNIHCFETASPYNSAIAACGAQKDWEAALFVLSEMPRHLVSNVSVSAVLMALAKARRGTEALELIHRAQSGEEWGTIRPNRCSYHHALSALCAEGKVQEACELVLHMQKQDDPKVRPTEETYRRLTSSVAGKPEAMAIVERLLAKDIDQGCLSCSFQPWRNELKVGQGKDAFWRLGKVRVKSNTSSNYNSRLIIVGLQPNRNPATNGMKLVFYESKLGKDENEDDMSSNNLYNNNSRIGYLLMINSAKDRTSTFLGQFIKPEYRGEGLAKILLAVWFQLCLDANILAKTGRIQKPLLSLVLQHSFGMLPQEGGVNAELSPGDDSSSNEQVVLYSSGVSLEGALSPLDLRNLSIRISTSPIEPRGRPIVIGCTFEQPHDLREHVDTVLQGHWRLDDEVADDDLGCILLGTSTVELDTASRD